MAKRTFWSKKPRPYKEKPAPRRWGTRAWKPEALLLAVRDECFKALEQGNAFIIAEEVTATLRAKKSSVTTAFQKLIHEGIIGHKARGSAHDGEWTPSVYTLIIRRRDP